MRRELEKKLEEEFSFMKRGKSLAEQKSSGYIDDLYGAFGLECGDGWYDLIKNMCTEIMQVYNSFNIPVNLVVDQIKEKYGTLRFYYYFNDEIKEIQEEYKKQIAEIVLKYEEKSETVCEDCGKPGILRSDLAWILTLCDGCYENRLKDIEERDKRYQAFLNSMKKDNSKDE